MAYKNPIPSFDDEVVAKRYIMEFDFEDYVSKKEACEGINRLIKENGGIDESWIKAIGTEMRYKE